MILDRMKELFYEHTSSLASDLSEGEVDEYLNRAYQFTVPLDIGGEFTDEIYSLPCVVGQRVYSYPSQIVGLRTEAPWIDSKTDPQMGTIDLGPFFLAVDTDPAVFRTRTRYTSSDGRPSRMLMYAKQVEFDRAPEQPYLVKIPVRSGPLVDLTTDGIDHSIHAMAVVTGAATDYLTTLKDTESVSEEAGNYARYRDQLRTYSQARPNRRRPARSF